ncbi:hypothetical protein [Robertmurraya massiliosenegalensis]|nr:hypothetical protein [Robertmurraya massiliosenegalensis]
MMGGHGIGMMGFGLLGWVLNLLVNGIVVYFAVKIAIKNTKL